MLPERPSLSQASPARRQFRKSVIGAGTPCHPGFLTAGHRPELSKVDRHGTVGPARHDAARWLALRDRRLRGEPDDVGVDRDLNGGAPGPSSCQPGLAPGTPARA